MDIYLFQFSGSNSDNCAHTNCMSNWHSNLQPW